MIYGYKADKYLTKYLKSGGDHLENIVIMHYLTELYSSPEFKRLARRKQVLTNTNISESDSEYDTDTDTDEETCPTCTAQNYCSSCHYTSICGCRMTASFFYLGYLYVTEHLVSPITKDKLATLDKTDLVNNFLTLKDSFACGTILEGLMSRKQQANYNNYLKDGPNIVAIFQKFKGTDPNAHAFHYLFVLKDGDRQVIRQSWYDGGVSNVKLNYQQLEEATNLRACHQMVMKTQVTKSQLLDVYGSFLTAEQLSENRDIFQIYVLNP